MKIISFSYRTPIPPSVDVPLDCRVMNNPHNIPKLKPLTGLAPPVQAFVGSDRHFDDLSDQGIAVLKDRQNVGFGCVGGKHRSVAMAEMLAVRARAEGFEVEVEHWALEHGNYEKYLSKV